MKMIDWVSKSKLWWIFFIGLWLGLSILRCHNYSRYPGVNHAEELLYSWSGIYLIEEGVPVSWSTLDYPKENLIYDGMVGTGRNTIPAKLYRPWLDEPPLYSLLSGGAAHLFGDNRKEVLSVAYTRIPSVVVGVISILVLGLIVYKMFGKAMSLLTMLVYGLSPIMTFGSRLSVPENMIAFGVVIGLYLIYEYSKKPRISIAILISLITIVLGLMKPTGFFMAPLFIFYAFKNKRWSDIGIVVAAVIIGVGLFGWYGYSIDWELFKKIVAIQGTRFAGWTGLGYILTSPAYDIFEMFDGWYIFSLIWAVYVLFKNNLNKEWKMVSMFTVYWLIVALLAGTEQDLLPWYRYPIFPLLSIFGAYGLINTFKNPTFFKLTFLFGLMMTGRFYMANEFRSTTPTLVFRIMMFVILVPSLLDAIYKKSVYKNMSRVIVVVFMVIASWENARLLYNMFELRCESKECLIGKSTWLSDIKMPILWRWLKVNDGDGTIQKTWWF